MGEKMHGWENHAEGDKERVNEEPNRQENINNWARKGATAQDDPQLYDTVRTKTTPQRYTTIDIFYQYKSIGHLKLARACGQLLDTTNHDNARRSAIRREWTNKENELRCCCCCWCCCCCCCYEWLSQMTLHERSNCNTMHCAQCRLQAARDY